MTDPTPSVSEHCVRHACKRRELEMRERIATLESALAEARRDGERKSPFTPAQLQMFAHLATEKANREAALCYPADDPRIERAAQELMVVYYRQYTQPYPAAIANQEPSHG